MEKMSKLKVLRIINYGFHPSDLNNLELYLNSIQPETNQTRVDCYFLRHVVESEKEKKPIQIWFFKKGTVSFQNV